MLLLLGSGFVYLRVKLEGPDLGDKIASILNKRMRGRITIESVEWPTSALKTALTGGWVPIRIRGVKVWDDCALSAGVSAADPEQRRLGDPNEDCTPDDKNDPDPSSHRLPRKLLLDTPEITGELDLHAIMFGNHDFVFRRLRIHGGEALLEETREPYPLHAYDRTIVSIVTAFYPRMKAGFRAGIYAEAPAPIFDLRDIHVEHLNLTANFVPWTNSDGTVGYGMAARIEDVNADPDLTDDKNNSYLYMDATDPLIAKFYVRLSLHGGHTFVRIRDEGPRSSFHIPGTQGLDDSWAKGRQAKYELELSEITLKRLAQMPTEWERKDYVAKTLELDLTAHTIPCKTEDNTAPSAKDGADLHLSGELANYWDRPYDGAWNLGLDVKNFGPTLHTCIKSKMGGDNLGGHVALTGPFIASPKVTLDLHGLDFDVPLSSTEEPVRLTLAEVHGEIDLVNEQGSIEKTKALVRGGKEPGEVMVSATFGLKPYYAEASVDITKPIDVGRFLPAKVATSVGRFLSGKLSAKGDTEEGFALEDFDLALGATPTEKAIRAHKGRLFTNDDFDTIKIQKVAIDAGKSHAVFDGWVNTVTGTLKITVDGFFPDLGVWLKRFGLPQFAASAGGGGTITITGPIKTPTVATRINLGGVPCLSNLTLDASVDTATQIATVNHISSTGLGGTLDGKGRVQLGVTPVIESFHLDGKRLDTSKLCGLGTAVSGTLDSIDLDVKRTVVAPNRTAIDWLGSLVGYVQAHHLTVLGDRVSDLALCLNHGNDDKLCRPWAGKLDDDDLVQCEDAKRRGGFCAVAAAIRDTGGRLAATIIDVPASNAPRHPIAAHLGGTVAIDAIPLAVLDQLVGAGTLGGLVSATLHLDGKIDASRRPAPQASGTIYLQRSWLAQAFVGDGQLQVSPVTLGSHPGIRIYGPLLAGQLAIDAMIGTEAPYAVDVAITGRRVELDQFLDLQKQLGMPEPVQAWASGTVTVHTELAPLSGKPAQPEAWVEITELAGIVNHRSRDGRQTPLRFQLQPPQAGQYAMSLRVTPATIELACRRPSAPGGREPCPAWLETPAGIVSIEGNATQTQMDLRANGSLDLRRLAPLLENQLEALDGKLDLHAQVTGTFAKPSYAIGLEVHDAVSLQLAGGDTKLQILGPHKSPNPDDPKTPIDQPGAQLKLANGSIGFNSFTINVNDERKAEQGELHVKGTIGLDGLRPTRWGVLIDGTIAGKMLQALAPGAIAQASGLARIDGALTLSGTGLLPKVSGTLAFDPDPEDPAHVVAPLTLSPRAVRREIALLAGSIDISTDASGGSRTYALTIDDNPITASIDAEGKLEHLTGSAVVRDGAVESAEIDLDADNVPLGIEGTLDLTLAGRNISLVLPRKDAAWRARGNIAIVSGRYLRNFDVTDAIKPAPPVVAPAKPFWDEYPSIGNADLDLTLDVRRFAVENNFANAELSAPGILIKGSPRDPRLSGSLRVQRGEFKIPGTRARFTRTTGSIDFAENEKATNPKLDITSDAPDYTDLSGQQHIITMTIFGTLEQPLWDLKTNTGLDRSQTLALLLLGRNPEQLRRSLGDTSLGSDPTRVDPTTNPSTGFADQIVKDLAGDWVSDLIGGELTKIIPLDILRFEIGFGSFKAHGEMKLLENIKTIGEYEQTIRGYTRNVRVELATPWHLPWKIVTDDRFTVQGGYLDKNFYDPAEQDIQDLQGKLVYRLFIP